MSAMKIQKGLPVRPQQINPEAKLREASKMYEEYFLSEMVKAMRQTVDHSSLNEPSMAEKIYSEKLDGQRVEAWANRGGVGLADIIYNQISERFMGGGGRMRGIRPEGPVQIQKGTTIKIDESHTQPSGSIPIVKPQSTLPKNEVSFLYEFDKNSQQTPTAAREVKSPYDGEVLQLFRAGEDRQVIKLAHDDGLVSTLSFVGRSSDLRLGEQVAAGQKLGSLSHEARGLTWQLAQSEA